MEPNKKKCSGCEYGERMGNVVKCRRYPAVGDGKATASVDHQPIMKEDDWCGEYE